MSKSDRGVGDVLLEGGGGVAKAIKVAIKKQCCFTINLVIIVIYIYQVRYYGRKTFSPIYIIPGIFTVLTRAVAHIDLQQESGIMCDRFFFSFFLHATFNKE